MQDDEEKLTLLEIFWFFLSLVIFFGTLVPIVVGIYVSAAAIPFITASLTATLSLTFVAPWIIGLLAVLPLISSISFLLEWAEVHWMILTLTLEEFPDDAIKEIGLYPGWYMLFLLTFALTPLQEDRHERYKFMNLEVMTFNDFDPIKGELKKAKPNDIGTTENEAKGDRTSIVYLFAAALSAVAVGLFLAVKIGAWVMATMISSLSLPYGVALLGAIGASLGLVIFTYQLLSVPVRLRLLWLHRNFLYSFRGENKRQIETWFKFGFALLGVGLGAVASQIFFGSLMAVLTTVLGPFTAGFTTVAVCCGLTLSLMQLLIKLFVEFPMWVKKPWQGNNLGKGIEISAQVQQEAADLRTLSSGRKREHTRVVRPKQEASSAVEQSASPSAIPRS